MGGRDGPCPPSPARPRARSPNPLTFRRAALPPPLSAPTIATSTNRAQRHLQAGGEEVIIVEGELDKLALNEAGFPNVLSVPDGAPSKPHDGPLPNPKLDTKFSYVHACEPLLARAARVILATDNDAPGAALAHELARRLGRDRCMVVQWPSDAGSSLAAAGGAPGGAPAPPSPPSQQQPAAAHAGNGSGAASSSDAAAAAPNPYFRKDANEVLIKDGPAALRRYVEAAQPLPISGLQRFGAFWDELLDLYWAQQGAREAAAATGWAGVDGFYKVGVGGEGAVVLHK